MKNQFFAVLGLLVVFILFVSLFNLFVSNIPLIFAPYPSKEFVNTVSYICAGINIAVALGIIFILTADND